MKLAEYYTSSDLDGRKEIPTSDFAMLIHARVVRVVTSTRTDTSFELLDTTVML